MMNKKEINAVDKKEKKVEKNNNNKIASKTTKKNFWSKYWDWILWLALLIFLIILSIFFGENLLEWFRPFFVG